MVQRIGSKAVSYTHLGSGGENQAPFYIAICASLLQIYDKCENSIRLALLDEAFSRMTSDRIRPMMQMPVSYTHLDVYKRQLYGRTGHDPAA